MSLPIGVPVIFRPDLVERGGFLRIGGLGPERLVFHDERDLRECIWRANGTHPWLPRAKSKRLPRKLKKRLARSRWP